MIQTNQDPNRNTELILREILSEMKKNNQLMETLIKEIGNLKHSISSDLSCVETAIDRIQGQGF